MTPSQHFMIWFLFKEEKKERETMRNPEHVFSVTPCSVLRPTTFRALEKQQLVEPFQGTETRKLQRGGRGIIRVGYTKTVEIERWRLTEKGRKLGATLPVPSLKGS